MTTVLELCATFILGGGITALVTIPWVMKKARAEARSLELENIQKAVSEWQKIADERQEQVAEYQGREKQYIDERDRLNQKVDELYTVNSGWRDRYNDLQTENTRLQVQAATNEVKLCLKRNCPDREPQSGW